MSILPILHSGPAPSGTVTFLFTDIERSTRRWEQYPQQMQHDLERHDTLLREAIEANNGYVFKTVGDAFCAAFPTAVDALSATLSAHRALQAEEWGETGPLVIRVGLHTGIAQERDGDYFGPTLNRVARLQAAGYGQQTLLSLPTYELVRDHLPSGVEIRDMGEHRLKDLLRPERVYQLITPDLPAEFPPLRTLDNRPNNLPRQTTAFIGRGSEIEGVAALVRKSGVSLITLTGPGGTGKTRLALQVAADLLDDFSDGVWFVELSTITEPRLVIPTIAQALGVKEAGGGTPIIDTLKAYLKEKQLLLLLDNFEQVSDAAGEVSQLLATSPGLKVLSTSRVPLRIRGEKEYAVSPLELPDIKHLPPLEHLTQYEAVRLFIDRATDVKADFEVTNENAPSVAEICVRLDGLPLAIELAAARVKMLPPQALLTRLSNRLKLLTGGARNISARQQTLRGAIDWSYDLLEEAHKQFFRRMAPFTGGQTLEAMEAVCNYDGELQVEVFDGAETLLSNNLIQQREGSDGEPRFMMLETIHEYAREKLQESGEAKALQRAHALYFMKRAEEAEPNLTGAREQEWLEWLEDEHHNLGAALRWAREKGETESLEIGLRIAAATWRFWNVRGYWSEGREELEGLLSRAVLLGCSKGVKARVLNGAGTLAWCQGDYSTARSLLEDALALGREVGDNKTVSHSLTILGHLALDQRNYGTARALYEESLVLRKELGDKWGTDVSLANLGSISYAQGDYATARALYEESLALGRELGYKGGIAWSLYYLGDVAYMQGQYSTARSLHEESLALRRELGAKVGTTASLNILGYIAQIQGDYSSARALHLESLQISMELGEKWGIAVSLAGLGEVKVERGEGQAGRGVRLLGASDELHEASGGVMAPEDLMLYDRAVATARSQLGEEAFEQARQEGRAMSTEEAITYALEEAGDD